MRQIMPKKLPTTTALYARKTIAGEHSLRQLALCGKLNIRGNADDQHFGNAIKNVTGVALPRANTVAEKESNKLYWLGPDEWLLHCDLDKTAAIQAALRNGCGGSHYAVTEVSDYYTVMRLRGTDAAALLSKGCPLDLHDNCFQSGAIARTRFGNASILLHKLGDGESWDIQVRWSYAEYCWDYLLSGMQCL